jgi:putative transposase
VGVDRGVAVSAALSTGEMLTCPRPSAGRQRRLKRLQRRLARARRDSNRRAGLKLAVARLKIREADARKDWAEKLSTDLARRFDLIRVEDLRVRNMTRSAKGTVTDPGHNVRAKAGLNRQILASGWSILIKRLEQKAPGRIEKISPVHTSRRCSACGHVARENRKSQAVFACTACRYTANADVNAAANIAAGHAVDCAGRLASGQASEPRTLARSPIPMGQRAEIPARQGREDVNE